MSNTDTMVYHDKIYGFSLRLPKWWTPYILIRSGGRDSGADYALHLLFRYDGKIYGDVLTILVYKMTLKKWRRYYDDSPLVPIAERRGRVYAYSVPGELPYAFVDPDTGEYDEERFGEPIRLMRTMVNEDVPVIAESLRWPEAVPAAGMAPKPYLSDRVTPGTRHCG